MTAASHPKERLCSKQNDIYRVDGIICKKVRDRLTEAKIQLMQTTHSLTAHLEFETIRWKLLTPVERHMPIHGLQCTVT